MYSDPCQFDQPWRTGALGMILVLASALPGCLTGGDPASPTHSPNMYDCRFQNNGHLHLHLSLARGSGSVITGYEPGRQADHAADLRAGRESEGRLVQPGPGNRYAVELFLLNDHFGERPGEKVVIRVGEDGRSRVEATGVEVNPRVIDFGTCSSAGYQHSSAH